MKNMEQPRQNLKESGMSKIINVEPADEIDILNHFKNEFNEQTKNKLEKEHPQELDDAILAINNFMKNFLKQYGIEAVNIPIKNIYLIDRSKLTEEQAENLKKRARKTAAIYDPERQEIIMLLNYEDDKKLVLFQSLVHEILHTNSFISYTKFNNQEGGCDIKLTERAENNAKKDTFLKKRRLGFNVYRSDGTICFNNLDEAIITELTMRFDWKYFSQLPQLAEEYKRRQYLIQDLIEKESRVSGKKLDFDQEKRRRAHTKKKQQADGSWTITAYDYPYIRERRNLNKLTDDLFEKNKSEFSSKEEVFNLFVMAAMTGKLLPIARLIEKTYGKGSFRELGEKTTSKKDEDNN